MYEPRESRLTRIGVFYDGNFFNHVSNYYLYNHPRKARISVAGLHEFIRQQVSEAEGTDVRYCQIVDSHYFRGRLNAEAAERRGALKGERQFDEILMREGIVSHYLPLGPNGEKGIDVWLALEAYELAIYKRFDVFVLIAGDGDFLPLIRKLNTIGARVMLLAWDFKFTDQNNQERETRTAQSLLDEATYPMMMHQLIDDRSKKNDVMLANLFVQPRPEPAAHVATAAVATQAKREVQEGQIQNLKEGYGFIAPSAGGNGIFFHRSHLQDADFNDLEVGMKVRYIAGENEKGPCALGIELVE